MNRFFIDFGSPRSLKGAKGSPKDDKESPKGYPKESQERPKRRPGKRKGAQGTLKSLTFGKSQAAKKQANQKPDSSKTELSFENGAHFQPRRTKERPRGPPKAHRNPKRGPSKAKGGPQRAEGNPKEGQERPKGGSGRPKGAQGSPKGSRGRAQGRPKGPQGRCNLTSPMSKCTLPKCILNFGKSR